MSSTAAMVEGAPVAQPTSTESRRAIYAASIGNVMEWYDFNLFAFMAPMLAANFFPRTDATAALLSTFAVFGVGLLFRPLGGIVIGLMGDRLGRKPALITTILVMAASTAIVGLLPTYDSIGILAPLLLVVARLMQGFSTGGEWGGATTFMAEWSESGRRGFYTSLMQMSNAVGLLLGSGMAALLATLLAPEDMNSWGWRIPFLIGALFGPIGLWLRRSIDETPRYRAIENQPSSEKEPGMLNAALRAIGFSAGWTVCFYAFLNFMPTYARTELKLSISQALWSNTIGIVVFTICVPLMGALSDRVGRRPLLLTSCAVFFLLPLPAFWSLTQGWGFPFLVLMQIVFAIGLSLYSGPGPAAIAELFPTRGRSTFLSISFSLSVAIFGGFTPFISQWLITATGSPLAPTIYIMAAACLSFFVVLRMRETAHEPLR